MSILQQIQSDAINSSVPAAMLLRKCQVLAFRLGNQEFENWVMAELNGYSADQQLPAYRSLHVVSKGNFVGMFGRQLHNAPMPLLNLPEKLQKLLEKAELRMPIAELESLVASFSSGNWAGGIPWDTDFVAHSATKFYEDMHCVEAWKILPESQLVAIVDSVRNKVLKFALEIEREAPNAGDFTSPSAPLTPEKVGQIFNTNIYGNVQNLATANTNVQQTATYNERDPEIFRHLLKAIATSGASAIAISEASRSVMGMASSKTRGNFCEHYGRFTSSLSDHIQIATAVLPFLPTLAGLLS